MKLEEPRPRRQPRAKVTQPTAPQASLHLGCGLDYRPGSINVDRYDLTAADLQADALRLPLARESVCQIEARHLVEHLGYAGTVYALAEWRRVLAPGGRLNLETPDRLATCRAAAEPDPPAPALHWLFGLPRMGYAHRSLFDEGDLEDLAARAGLVEVEVIRQETAQPTLRVRARKGHDLDLAHLESLCKAIEAAVARLAREEPEACLQRVLGAAARLDPRAALAAIQVLRSEDLVPDEVAGSFLELAEALIEEAFPARLAAWLRRHPSPPATQPVRWQRLPGQISRYLAARLFPDEAALQPTRQTFDAETARPTAGELEVTFFCAEALAELSQREATRGLRAFAQGDMEQAEARFQTAMAYDADNALAAWNWARLATACGHRLEALERYAGLLQIVPGAAQALRPELDAATGRHPGMQERYAVPASPNSAEALGREAT
jgi:hypothetical protein